MAFDESKYRMGYSLGVGGVVLCGEKVLLARRALGNAGDWAIPGGYVERDEPIGCHQGSAGTGEGFAVSCASQIRAE